MESTAIEQLTQVVKKLRDPENGCPWDLKQTHESLLKYLIEESYEFVQAVEDKEDTQMKDEIGDVLLQVLLHCQLASERGAFDLESVAHNLKEKLVRRHPHVFGENPSKITSEQVKEQWQEIKSEERKDQQKEYAINKKHLAAPALLSAHKIGAMTSKLNFDWQEASQVLYKVEEEWQELKEEIVPEVELNNERIAEEMGDFLFSTAQLARHANLNPEEVLRQANKKFIRRFNRVEELMNAEGFEFEQLNQKQLDQYWYQAKMEEKQGL